MRSKAIIALSLLLLVMMIGITACFRFKGQTLLLEDALFKLDKNKITITANCELSGIEISLKGDIPEEAVVVPSALLRIVGRDNGLTKIAIASVNGNIANGSTIGIIEGSFKSLNDLGIQTHSRVFQLSEGICDFPVLSEDYPEGFSINPIVIESLDSGDLLIHAKSIQSLLGVKFVLEINSEFFEVDIPKGNSGVTLMGSATSGLCIVRTYDDTYEISVAFSSPLDILEEDIIAVHIKVKDREGKITVPFSVEAIDNLSNEMEVSVESGLIEIGGAGKLLGDFDETGVVELVDFIQFARKYGYQEGNENYSIIYDIAPAQDKYKGIWNGIYDWCEPDGSISLVDFIVFARNYGKTLPSGVNTNPAEPNTPNPANGSQGISVSPTLQWSCADPDGDELLYDIYFGKAGVLELKKSNLKETSWDANDLDYSEIYWWKVVARDGRGGVSESPVWSFTTRDFPESPDISWQKTYGGSRYDDVSSIIEKDDGNILVLGSSYSCDGDLPYGSGPAFYHSDVWLFEIGVAHQIEQSTTYKYSEWLYADEFSKSIFPVSDNGYLILGTAGSTPQMWLMKIDTDYVSEWDLRVNDNLPDDLVGAIQLVDGSFIVAYNTDNKEVTLSKVSTSGVVLWTRSYGGSGHDWIKEIIDTNDGVLFVATSSSFDGDVSNPKVPYWGPGYETYDIWVVKANQQGDIVWEKSIGGSRNDTAASMKERPSGGFVVVGSTSSTDLDVVGRISDDEDGWIVGLDNQGQIEWQKSVGGTGSDSFTHLISSNSGGYILLGTTTSSDGDIVNYHGGQDIMVAKVDEQGTLEWVKCYGGTGDETPKWLEETDDGELIIVGTTTSSDGDVSGYHGEEDIWVLSLDSQGNMKWQKCLGGTGTEKFGSAIISQRGTLVIAASTNSTDGDITGNQGDYDVWIVEISAKSNRLPSAISNAFPENNAQDVSCNTGLSWSCYDADGDELRYDVYFGTSSTPSPIVYNITESTYIPGALNDNTRYYWKVVARDEHGSEVSGPVWSFLTETDLARMIRVESIDYWIGDIAGNGYSNEWEPTLVKLTYDYEIGKYEVSFEEYDSFCDDTEREKPSDEGWGRGNRPVINVSWLDAISYCNWLSLREGLMPAYDELGNLLDAEGKITEDITKVEGYRLPTEAEWEIAARGGKLTKNYIYSGSNVTGEVAWYLENSNDKTNAIGRKLKNELGIHDMSGNALEWCHDGYSDSPPKKLTNPVGKGETKVLKGGSWARASMDSRVSARYKALEEEKTIEVGFRLARTANREPIIGTPVPTDGFYKATLEPVLAWSCVDVDGEELRYDVYFGNEENPPIVLSNSPEKYYIPGKLNENTTYYWRVLARDKFSEVSSAIWTFTTTIESNEFDWKSSFGRDKQGSSYVDISSVVSGVPASFVVSGTIEGAKHGLLGDVVPSNPGIELVLLSGNAVGVYDLSMNLISEFAVDNGSSLDLLADIDSDGVLEIGMGFGSTGHIIFYAYNGTTKWLYDKREIGPYGDQMPSFRRPALVENGKLYTVNSGAHTNEFKGCTRIDIETIAMDWQYPVRFETNGIAFHNQYLTIGVNPFAEMYSSGNFDFRMHHVLLDLNGELVFGKLIENNLKNDALSSDKGYLVNRVLHDNSLASIETQSGYDTIHFFNENGNRLYAQRLRWADGGVFSTIAFDENLLFICSSQELFVFDAGQSKEQLYKKYLGLDYSISFVAKTSSSYLIVLSSNIEKLMRVLEISGDGMNCLHDQKMDLAVDKIEYVLPTIIQSKLVLFVISEDSVLKLESSNINTPPLQPYAEIPLENSTGRKIDTVLSWKGEDPDGDALTYDVYFGKSGSPTLVAEKITVMDFWPGWLEYDTEYFWKVVAHDGRNSTIGPLWSFTTMSASESKFEWICSYGSDDRRSNFFDVSAYIEKIPTTYTVESTSVYNKELLVGDVDPYNEGVEIVCLTGWDGTEISVFSLSFELLSRFTPNSGNILNLLADIDGDGVYEIGMGSDNNISGSGEISFYDSYGTAIWSTVQTLDNNSDIHPVAFSGGELFVLGKAAIPNSYCDVFGIDTVTGERTLHLVSTAEYPACGISYQGSKITFGTDVIGPMHYIISTDGSLEFMKASDDEFKQGRAERRFLFDGSILGLDTAYIDSWTCEHAPYANCSIQDTLSIMALDSETVVKEIFRLEMPRESFGVTAAYDDAIISVSNGSKLYIIGLESSPELLMTIPLTKKSRVLSLLKAADEYAVILSSESGSIEIVRIDVSLGEVVGRVSIQAAYSTKVVPSFDSGLFSLILSDDGRLIKLVEQETNTPPTIPYLPYPSDGATGMAFPLKLMWRCDDENGDVLSYDIYFGTSPTPPLVKENYADRTYYPSDLEFDTTYYWRVVAKDGKAESSSPVWSFTTRSLNSFPYIITFGEYLYTDDLDVAVRREFGPFAAIADWEEIKAEYGELNTFATFAHSVGLNIGDNVLLQRDGERFYIQNNLWVRHYFITLFEGFIPGTFLSHDSIPYNDSGLKYAALGSWFLKTRVLVRLSESVNPDYPSPDDGSTGVEVDKKLSWSYIKDSNQTTYDVYFGTNEEPPLVITGLTERTYDPGQLLYNTHYYWKVVAHNDDETTNESSVWTFKSAAEQSPAPVTDWTRVSFRDNHGSALVDVAGLLSEMPTDFEVSSVRNGASAILAGDVSTANAGLELVIWQKPYLSILSPSMNILNEFIIDDMDSLDILADIDGDGYLEIGMGCLGTGEIRFYDSSGNVVWLYSEEIGYDARLRPGIMENGKLYVVNEAGYSGHYRGISSIDMSTKQLDWRYLVGPDVREVFMNEGALTFGTNTPHNCGLIWNGFDDGQMFHIVISKKGTLLLGKRVDDTHKDGGVNSRFLFDGTLVGLENHSGFYPGTQKLHILDSEGNQLLGFDLTYKEDFMPELSAAFDSKYLAVSDAKNLYLFDVEDSKSHLWTYSLTRGDYVLSSLVKYSQGYVAILYPTTGDHIRLVGFGTNGAMNGYDATINVGTNRIKQVIATAAEGYLAIYLVSTDKLTRVSGSVQ